MFQDLWTGLGDLFVVTVHALAIIVGATAILTAAIASAWRIWTWIA